MGMILNPYSGGNGPATDPYFANVVFLSHFNGSNGATTLTDSSSYNRTSTVHGNAQLTTTGPKFGSACGLFDGTGDNWTFPTSTDFDFGAGGFTIEGFAYADVNNEVNFIISNRSLSGGDNGWYVFIDSSGKLGFVGANAGTNNILIAGSTTIPTSTWFSWAVADDGSTCRIFYNGVVDGTDSSLGTGIAASNGLLYIGSSSAEDGTRDWKGKLDEIRITKGICRYTSTYSDPAQAFPDS